ncbi:heterokaryon incompatibility protein-domain-containing protein [Pisolithus marmoratus]|nr:heterokaryon incompatibility protein-domain-containing protein [Pisolithus marmoratus]
MWLLDVVAVLDWDKNIPGTDPEAVVLKGDLDDSKTAYAILSHRWTDSEVSYEEMTRLAKMDSQEREEIKRRDGYEKITRSCALARGRYKWLWIDTCCIDKRSSTELSEAINSMYRWYQNSQVCYAYLHDVEMTFPTTRNHRKFSRSNGWPEWFVRGWTLQELIAPTEVQFFNKAWVDIGSKRHLASTLADITGIPVKILLNGVISEPRPSVAQVISWAADRKTNRVEDRAYSLLGLLGVNMPMVYGEGEGAFRRLQRKIIRESNDQSIFAWDPHGWMPRYGSVLADDPSYFRDCNDIERVDFDKFSDELIKYIRGYNLDDLESRESELHRAAQQLGEFDVTNAGIRIRLPLIPYRDFPSTFKAILACRQRGNLVTIDLALRGQTYDRSCYDAELCQTYPEFRLIKLSHSRDANETQHRLTLDDRHTSFHGFTRCITYPREVIHDNVTLSSWTWKLLQPGMGAYHLQ